MNNTMLFIERLKSLFRRRPNRFITQLCGQAALTVSGLDALIDYMNKPSDKNAQRIHRLEQNSTEQEMEIRKQLKLLRPGETTFILEDPPSKGAAAPQSQPDGNRP